MCAVRLTADVMSEPAAAAVGTRRRAVPHEMHRRALGRHRLAGVLADHRDQAAGGVDLVEPVVALEDPRPDRAGRGRRRAKEMLLRPHRRAASPGWSCRGSWRRTASPAARRPRAAGRSARRGPGSSPRCGRYSAIASAWSWVTRIVVVPTVRWIWRSSICISSRSLASRLDSGSSSSRMLRPDHQRAGQRHALLLAARQLAREARREGAEPDQLQRLGDPPGALGARRRPASRGRTRRSRPPSCAETARSSGTRCRGRAWPASPPAVAAFEPDRARRRLDEARDHLQGRGLAAARRAEQRRRTRPSRRRARGRRPRGAAEPLGQFIEDKIRQGSISAAGRRVAPARARKRACVRLKT